MLFLCLSTPCCFSMKKTIGEVANRAPRPAACRACPGVGPIVALAIDTFADGAVQARALLVRGRTRAAESSGSARQRRWGSATSAACSSTEPLRWSAGRCGGPLGGAQRRAQGFMARADAGEEAGNARGGRAPEQDGQANRMGRPIGTEDARRRLPILTKEQ